MNAQDKAATKQTQTATEKKTTEKKTANKPTLNIFQRMLAATFEISSVAKNIEVGFGKNAYKAVSEADVLEVVKPIEARHGIYSYPYSRKIIKDEIFTTIAESNGEKKEKNTFFVRVETVYRFVNTDNPTEYIDITTYGDGVDTQDKTPGKAMTYGDKYALLKAYKIRTGDDPDEKASGDLKKKPTTPINKPTTARLKEAQDLKLDLNKVAAYLKKSVEEISDDDLAKSIQMQKDAIENLRKKAEREKAAQEAAQKDEQPLAESTEEKAK